MLCKFSDINCICFTILFSKQLFSKQLLQLLQLLLLQILQLYMNGLFVCNTLNNICWLFEM